MPRLVLRRLTGVLALFGTIAMACALIAAQAPGLKPSEEDQVTAAAVSKLLERGHLSHPRINDEVAKKWANNFLKALDPQKYYFLKDDVDGFLTEQTTLDDKIRDGDISWAKKVFERYLQRSDERLAKAQDYLKEMPDFTADESIVDDPDRLDWPKTADEANDRLRRRIKYDLLRLKTGKIEPEKALKQLRVRYKDINRSVHLFDSADLLEMYLTSLATVIDPHSTYMGWKTVEDFMNQSLHLSLEGIGASLMMEDGYPTVKEIVAGAAADKDGRLKPEDKIVGIEGENGEREDFVEKKLSDVVRKIRGKAGSKVKLIVQPHDQKELKIYELTRAKVELADQRAKGQVIEAKGANDKPVKLGVIHLSSFYGDMQAVLRGDKNAPSATLDCRHLIDGFKKQGVDAVVVDLRGNGGGLLQEAITLSGLFIDQGPVVQVRDAGRVRQYDDDDAGTAWDGPLAVLIDRFSASASEIFAGVIKDYNRGLIVGDKSTYGKGTVQQIISLNDQLGLRDQNAPNLGALKLTIQQFFRANGESTQIKGVTPDIHLPSLRDAGDIGEGKSDSALPYSKIDEAPHDNYGRVPADLVARLNERSAARRDADPKYKELKDQIRKFNERKARHEISLNEQKFKSEVLSEEEEADDAKPASDKGDDKDKDKDKPKDEAKTSRRHADQPAWESSYVNDEIARIIADYVTIGSNAVATTPPRHAKANGR